MKVVTLNLIRVKNILNRIYDFDKPTKIIQYDIYKVDMDKRVVYEKDEVVTLTSKEYDLVLFLLENKGKAFSREQILLNVWGNDYFGSDRVVDDLLRRVRQKLSKLDVETIYGYGYRLR